MAIIGRLSEISTNVAKLFYMHTYGRYSTCLYPDQDANQYPYPEDFNADTLFHVSVSVKRICLFLPYFKQCLHNIVIIHMQIQHLLSKMWWQVSFFIIYTCPIARIRCIMHLSIFCPPGGAAGIHGALDRRPFLTGGNLINLWNPGPG